MAGQKVSLVLLETSGNQAYIYATNKLRENVGASELTRLAGTKWVLDAVQSETQVQSETHQELYNDPNQLRAMLTNVETNGRIEDGALVEVVEAASGKAVLLVRDPKTAKRIVSKVTLKALTDAPGLDIKGVVVEFDWSKSGSVADALRKAYRRYEELRTSRPGPESRFLRLPVVAQCATSGMPASTVEKNEAFSMQTSAKRAMAHEIRRQKTEVGAPAGWKFADALDDQRWLAVVHADGNGLGQVFLHFEDFCNDDRGAVTNRNYVDTLRAFSCAVDVCTHKAFEKAVESIVPCVKDEDNNEKTLPMRPLVLGGDDLTVMCDAAIAFPFAERYLAEFEAETANDEVIRPIAKRMTNGKMNDAWLSACAGIAVVKSHYPFFAAYSLAEELVASAKTSKKKLLQKDDGETGWSWPSSALDFLVLHDSSSMELKDIRDKLVLDDGETLLYGGPYVVTGQDQFKGLDQQQKVWTEFHAWTRLKDRAEVLRKKDREGKREIPNSQVHELRAALFGGRASADRALRLIAHRYQAVSGLLEQGFVSLFASDTMLDGSNVYVTQLLDAMEVENFLSVEENSVPQGKEKGD